MYGFALQNGCRKKGYTQWIVVTHMVSNAIAFSFWLFFWSAHLVHYGKGPFWWLLLLPSPTRCWCQRHRFYNQCYRARYYRSIYVTKTKKKYIRIKSLCTSAQTHRYTLYISLTHSSILHQGIFYPNFLPSTTHWALSLSPFHHLCVALCSSLLLSNYSLSLSLCSSVVIFHFLSHSLLLSLTPSHNRFRWFGFSAQCCRCLNNFNKYALLQTIWKSIAQSIIQAKERTCHSDAHTYENTVPYVQWLSILYVFSISIYSMFIFMFTPYKIFKAKDKILGFYTLILLFKKREKSGAIDPLSEAVWMHTNWMYQSRRTNRMCHCIPFSRRLISHFYYRSSI